MFSVRFSLWRLLTTLSTKPISINLAMFSSDTCRLLRFSGAPPLVHPPYVVLLSVLLVLNHVSEEGLPASRRLRLPPCGTNRQPASLINSFVLMVY